MKLYFYGHENVSQPAYPRVESTEGLAESIAQMTAMMIRHGLNGLAAPQVGMLQQLVVVKLKDDSIVELVNPRITKMYGPEYEMLEHCISCPPYENSCKVSRIQVVHVLSASARSLDDIGEYKFKGNDARVVQHEIDHLEGTFFFDRASNKDKTTVLHCYRAWKTQWKQDHQAKETRIWQPQ